MTAYLLDGVEEGSADLDGDIEGCDEGCVLIDGAARVGGSNS